ncbi:hypothetical protein CMI37_11815 [Candidatus Pacearchaeota archaeon]|nr:hypothetical protein [Candidatus Pacearchaeota archaeon]
MTLKDIEKKTGTLSKPSKMPGYGYSTPAEDCKTGSKLAKVENSICSICYARKGRYVFPNVKKALKKRLAAIERDDWVELMTDLIRRKEKKGFFRWHDSGDVQSVKHLKKIVAIANNLPEIKFWLPTREYKFVSDYLAVNDSFPANLTVRLSAFMVDGPPPKAFAERLGLTTSGVVEDDSFTCPSERQGNSCGDCRACWDGSVPNVGYHKH